MRLATFRTPRGTRAGRLEGDEIVELPYDDVGSLLMSGRDWRMESQRGDTRRAVAELDLAPLVIRPPKIICVGLNYRQHILEMGRGMPQYPTLFGTFARALIGARDQIVLPEESDKVDWEAELAFVMGRPVRSSDRSQAAAAIAGFTVLNDVSMRDWQWRTTQWLQGKTFESSTPVGPWLVTVDEILNDPSEIPNLEISCEVDGAVMQQARTGDLLFGPVDIVVYISNFLTLEPGDLIATGTPGGVGAGRNPPLFLQPGQTLRTTVEGIGELVNECVQGSK